MKIYEKPDITVLIYNTQNLMLSASPGVVDSDDDVVEAESKHNFTWGNLWTEDDTEDEEEYSRM